MTRDTLITALWEGAIGELEFWEVGLDYMHIDELTRVLDEIRVEDGVS